MCSIFWGWTGLSHMLRKLKKSLLHVFGGKGGCFKRKKSRKPLLAFWGKETKIKHQMCSLGMSVNRFSLPLWSSCIQEGGLPWKHRKYQIWATREAFLIVATWEVAVLPPKSLGLYNTSLCSGTGNRDLGLFTAASSQRRQVAKHIRRKQPSDKWNWWGIWIKSELWVIMDRKMTSNNWH